MELMSRYGSDFYLCICLPGYSFNAFRIQAKNGYGNTALHNACRCGSLESVDLLIAANADVNAVNHKGSCCIERSVLS
jgi:ankyrin repeat protein